MSKVKIKGLERLEKSIDNIPNKTMEGIEKAMEIIYQASQPKVPVDTGRLKESGVVEEVPNGYKIKYHANNPKTGYNYAPIQHENLNFNHKVGQAKYLEDAVEENMDKIIDTIVEEILK